MQLRRAAVYATDDDALKSEHLFFDQMDFLGQLGLLPGSQRRPDGRARSLRSADAIPPRSDTLNPRFSGAYRRSQAPFDRGVGDRTPKSLLDREANIGQLHGPAVSQLPTNSSLDPSVAESPRLWTLTGRRRPPPRTTGLQDRFCRLIWWV